MKKLLNKGFLTPLIIVAVLVLSAGGLYVYQKTKKESATTSQQNQDKIFRHKSGILSIAYPSDWTVAEENTGFQMFTPKGILYVIKFGLLEENQLQNLFLPIPNAVRKTEDIKTSYGTIQKNIVTSPTSNYNRTIYAIPLKYQNKLIYLYSLVYSNTGGPYALVIDELEPRLKAMTIDQSKIPELENEIAAASNNQSNATTSKTIVVKPAPKVEPISSYKTYKHSSGLFTLDYPSTWNISFTQLAGVQFDTGRARVNVYTSTNLGELKDSEKKSLTTSLGVVQEYTIHESQPWGSEVWTSSMYVIPVSRNGSQVYIKIYLPSGDASTGKIIEGLLNRIKIDVTKVETAFSLAKSAEVDEKIKSILTEDKGAANRYYTSVASYAGVCNSPDIDNKVRGLTTTYKCSDDKDYFVITALLPGEKVLWCADSMGNSVIVPSIPTGKACK